MSFRHSAAARALPSLVSAALVAGALSLAVFYHGPQIPLLAGAQALLILWLVISVARSYETGIALPITPLAVSLTLFWSWLAMSLAWSRVPAVSEFNLWWVGSFVLVFWIYTVAPERERVWTLVSRFALVGALALCVTAMVQVTVYTLPPRATFYNIHSFAALLMLVALPACAHLLSALAGANRKRAIALAAAVFIVFFTISLTRGRGTTISLLVSMVVLSAVLWRSAPRRHLALVLGLLGAAYLGANLLLHGDVTGRLATLRDPADAAEPRLLILRGSLQMALDNPWIGNGLGTYYLAWPPYRNPADSTLGFFAHNDYLQIWIEVGLPGLILLLGIFLSVLAMAVRYLRGSVPDGERRTEVTGLACGLLAVAVHSFVDFNFYILPISIVAGLMLGRFHERIVQTLPPRAVVLAPRRFVQGRVYVLLVALLALFPLMYLTGLAVSDHFYHQGLELAANGQLREADRAFTRGEALAESDDKILLAHADLFRHASTQLPPDAATDRAALYSGALQMLERAERANPYRALIYTVRGRLYQENPDLAGTGWREQMEQAYRRALVLNPRLLPTRMTYASALLQSGQLQAAREILNDGLIDKYHPDPLLVTYYAFAASLDRQAGDSDGAKRLEARIEETKLLLAQTAAVRPVVDEVELRATVRTKSNQ